MPDQTPRSAALPSMDQLRRLDAQYRSFPSLAGWRSSSVDQDRWTRYLEGLDRKAPNDKLRRATNIVKRAAAIDTGAIEGLYEVDQGFTITVATETAMWETALTEKGAHVRQLFEAQLRGYDRVLDLATQEVPIAEAWIRQLHAEITAGQETYLVATELGPQEQALPRGEYKHHANHVRKPDGTYHSYAPVEMVSDEMHRLCEVLRSDEFVSTHPVIQAAYAHYAFVIIHPFADGNGRVARALSSVFTCRASSVVLLILADRRAEYLKALRLADEGESQPFVDFIFGAAVDALRLAQESIAAAAANDLNATIGDITSLYTTKGGFTHDQVDQAGFKLIEAVYGEIAARAAELTKTAHLKVGTSRRDTGVIATKPEYRLPVQQGQRSLSIQCSTTAPAQASTQRTFQIEVPRDCGQHDDLLVRGESGLFSARIEEVGPITLALTMRIRVWVDGLFAQLLQELLAAAKANLKGSGR